MRGPGARRGGHRARPPARSATSARPGFFWTIRAGATPSSRPSRSPAPPDAATSKPTSSAIWHPRPPARQSRPGKRAAPREALALHQSIGALRQIAVTLENLAALAVAERRGERAARLLVPPPPCRETMAIPAPSPSSNSPMPPAPVPRRSCPTAYRTTLPLLRVPPSPRRRHRRGPVLRHNLCRWAGARSGGDHRRSKSPVGHRCARFSPPQDATAPPRPRHSPQSAARVLGGRRQMRSQSSAE